MEWLLLYFYPALNSDRVLGMSSVLLLCRRAGSGIRGCREYCKASWYLAVFSVFSVFYIHMFSNCLVQGILLDYKYSGKQRSLLLMKE